MEKDDILENVPAENSPPVEKTATNDKRFINRIKRPFRFLKKVTEQPREFMRAGRNGGVIAEAILGTQFLWWLTDAYTLERFPKIITLIISAVVFVIFSELLAILLKLILGGVKRCRVYFYFAFFTIALSNFNGTLFGNVISGLLMSFLLALSVNIIGRIIWAFVKTKRFSQSFAYIAGALSIIYLALFALFFHNDSFGKSRISFYNNIRDKAVTEKTPAAEDFDRYLQDGEYTVGSLTYGPESDADIVTETKDYSIFDSVKDRGFEEKIRDIFSDYDFSKTPVKGKIWYPEGEKNCPVLFFVHGNHVSSVPSYLGYEYLGQYLASNGYVVVSVDENIINELGEGNDKRALLLLDNMKALFAENEKKGSPVEGLFDSDRLAIGGHSRGGEMVATAYLFNDLDTYPEDGNIKLDYHFNIRTIVTIAPCVDQYMPVQHSVEISDVNYFIIHGANDQDVSSMMGEKQYNNITFSGNGEKYIKASLYVLGANHGQFNSLWGRYDNEGASNHYLNTNNFLDEAKQKLIAKAYIRTMLDMTLKKDDTYASLLKDNSPYLDYLPDTAYITNYEDSDFRNLASFDDTVDISSYGDDVSLEVTGTDTWTLDSYNRGTKNESEDFVLSCKWEKDSEPAVRLKFPSINIENGYMSFRIADMREDTNDLEEVLDYSVEFTDASGHTVSIEKPVLIYHSIAVQLTKQDTLFNVFEYKHQLQTVRVTPSMFENVSDFDFGAVTSITIKTDGKAAGSLIINDIGYSDKCD